MTEKKEFKILWMTLGDWAKIIITALIVSWWNSRTPALTFSVSDPVIFQGEQNKFAILGITVRNKGSKQAEKIRATFPIQKSDVKDIQITPSDIKGTTEYSKGGDAATVEVELLNPSQHFQISVMAANPDKYTTPVKPKVNAPGIEATYDPYLVDMATPAYFMMLIVLFLFICMFDDKGKFVPWAYEDYETRKWTPYIFQWVRPLLLKILYPFVDAKITDGEQNIEEEKSK